MIHFMEKVYCADSESQFFAFPGDIWYPERVIFLSMELGKFESLVGELIKKNISDLHITTTGFPYIRIHDGKLKPIAAFGKLTLEDIEDIIRFIYPKEIPSDVKSVDTAYAFEDARFRVNISRVLRGWCISLRMVPSTIPSPESIGLSQHLLDLTNKEK